MELPQTGQADVGAGADWATGGLAWPKASDFSRRTWRTNSRSSSPAMSLTLRPLANSTASRVKVPDRSLLRFSDLHEPIVFAEVQVSVSEAQRLLVRALSIRPSQNL